MSRRIEKEFTIYAGDFNRKIQAENIIVVEPNGASYQSLSQLTHFPCSTVIKSTRRHLIMKEQKRAHYVVTLPSRAIK